MNSPAFIAVVLRTTRSGPPSSPPAGERFATGVLPAASRQQSSGASCGLAAACLAVAASESASAHGLAGKRFFPATLVTEDPFVADELSFPTVSYRKLSANGEEPATRETDFSVDVSKRVTQNFGIGLGATYKKVQPEGATHSAVSTTWRPASNTSSIRAPSTKRSCRRVSIGTSEAAGPSESVPSPSARSRPHCFSARALAICPRA